MHYGTVNFWQDHTQRGSGSQVRSRCDVIALRRSSDDHHGNGIEAGDLRGVFEFVNGGPEVLEVQQKFI